MVILFLQEETQLPFYDAINFGVFDAIAGTSLERDGKHLLWK